MTDPTSRVAGSSIHPTEDLSGMQERSVVESVMDRVRTAIRNGRYGPGDRVIEAELARSFSVARSSVREALSRLAAEGLLEINRFRGASVRAMSAGEVEETMEIREMLEGLAARRAALAVARGASAAKVLDAQARMDDAVTRQSTGDFFASNADYHDAIFELAGSARLSAQLDQLFLPFLRVQNAAHLVLETLRRANDEHQHISAAIARGDSATAELHMRTHVSSTSSRLMRLIA